MPDAVEEVGIAEGDVPGAGGDLRPHVGHDDVDRDDPKAAVVDGHDRTVPAAMFAAAAGLGVADRPSFGAPLQGRVLRQRRQALTIRDEELDARDTRGLRRRRGATKIGHLTDDARVTHDARDQRLLELAAEDHRHAVLAEQGGVERRVEAVGDQSSVRIDGVHVVDHRQREPRGRVHREKEGDRGRAPHRRFAQALLREIGADDLGPGCPQRTPPVTRARTAAARGRRSK